MPTQGRGSRIQSAWATGWETAGVYLPSRQNFPDPDTADAVLWTDWWFEAAAAPPATSPNRLTLLGVGA